MSRRTLTLASFVAAFFAPQATADLITWNPVQDVTAPTDVSTTGTVVVAKNLHQSGGPWSPTVNGVTFDSWYPTGWNSAGWTTMGSSTTGDVEYDTLLDAARASSESPLSNPTPWVAFQIDTLGTLTVGEQYQIQLWFCDQRITTNTVNDRVMTFSSAANVTINSGTGEVTNFSSLTLGPLSGGVEADPNNYTGAGDIVFGQYVVGTFTRTTTDPLWILVQGTHPSEVLSSHLNAFQIREVSGSFTSYCFGDSSGTPCPCGNDNDGSLAEAGCANGQYASGARLTASGTASLSADTLVLQAEHTENSQSGLYFQADNDLSPGIVWGDGLRCAGGNLKRLGVRFSDPTGYSDTSSFANPISVKTGNITAGDTKYYQLWYRNPLNSPCANDFNASNGVAITWAP